MSALETPAPDAPAAEWGALAESIPGWADLPGDRSGPHRMPRLGPLGAPDPDHWAWEGWLWRLAGRPEVMMEGGGERVRIWGGTGPTLGRACIAYAAAFGRWPGGEQ